MIDGLDQGTTPAIVEVKRPGLGDTQVVLKLDGYEDKVFTLQSKFNAVSILNFAGIIGWGIDIATGAVKKYSPKGYNIEMEPESSSYMLEELPRDIEGAYIVPPTSEMVSIKDKATGMTYVFD